MKKYFLPLFVLFLIHLSCEKESSPTITEVKPGNITGILHIYDIDDNSGAFVSLKGTNISATTDYNGKWTLTNVEPGVYDLIFSKPGYDTTECYGFPFPGNGTAYCGCSQLAWATQSSYAWYDYWLLFKYSDNIINQLSVEKNFRIDTLRIRVWHDHEYTDSIVGFDTLLFFKGKLNYYGCFILFFDFSPYVSKDKSAHYVDVNYLSSSPFYQYDDISKSFILTLNFKYLRNYLGSFGTKVYMIAYPWSGEFEIDLRNNKRRWLGLGKPSDVVEFTIPSN